MENKLPQTYFSPVSENLQKLAELFPTAVKDGQLDVAALKEELGRFEEISGEKYELTWPGKKEAKRLALTDEDVADKTLKYQPGEGLLEDRTENLYIEGDNLEALKLLRNSYYGKIKMIYIDPPYNTGKDFVYRDNFTAGKEETAKAEGNMDENGMLLMINPESNARYHSNWLNMMYPRLRLAKDLLRDDGAVFISIDDTELFGLMDLCNEIFGEENFVANVIWQKKYAVSNDDPGIAPMHDYILVYKKSDLFDRNLLPRTEKQLVRYKNLDNDPRGDWSSDNYVSNKSRWERPTLWYPFTHPKTGKEVWPDENAVWRYSKDKHLQMERENRLYWGPDQSYDKPRIKRFLNEIQDGVVPSTWWPFTEVGHNDEAYKECGDLLGKKVFSAPKPVRLIKQILTIGANADSIILDFFSGSATTAHAVMQLNAEDGRNRKFIMVQIPEPTPEGSEARKAGYATIPEIGKERIRRAAQKICKELTDKRRQLRLGEVEPVNPDTLDLGFKVFRVGPTNIRWNAGNFDRLMAGQAEMKLPGGQVRMEDVKDNKDQLDFHINTKDIDVVYEVLLRHRDFPLSSPVQKLEAIGKRSYMFADAVVVCLESEITNKMVDGIAAITPKPLKVVFRDSAFGDDVSLKLNTMNRLNAQLSHYHGGEDTAFRVEFI